MHRDQAFSNLRLQEFAEPCGTRPGDCSYGPVQLQATDFVEKRVRAPRQGKGKPKVAPQPDQCRKAGHHPDRQQPPALGPATHGTAPMGRQLVITAHAQITQNGPEALAQCLQLRTAIVDDPKAPLQPQ
ncbi:hypothetical protein D3C72_1151820 [compost metagenome]